MVKKDMPGRTTRKANTSLDGEYRMTVMAILAESPDALTIDSIKQGSALLTGLSTQKMARILSYLIELGYVQKAMSKQKGRMMYKAVDVMRAQGYDVDGDSDEEDDE